MDNSSQKQSIARWFRRSYAGRIITALVLIAVIQLAVIWLNFLLPVQREHWVASKIEALGGQVEWQRRGPRWVYRLPYADNLQRITGITLGGEEVSAKVFQPVPAELISEIAALNWLEFLYLTGPLVTDKQILRLKGLKRTLDDIPQSLDLQGTQLTDSGLEHLKGLTNMDSLNLSSTQIGDAGLIHLSGFSSLTDLALSNTKISDEGLKHLSGLSSLTELALFNIKVTDEGLKHLVGLVNLEKIDLDDTQTTPEGRAMLRQALPRCLVIPEP